MDLGDFLYTISQFFQIIIFGAGCYLFSISIFGWYKRKEEPPADFPPMKRFALVVPAHNEEKVVAHIVDSLNRQNYPKHLYTIFVIADNCTDGTAAAARKEGAVVCERFDDKLRGKGFALEWMFSKLSEWQTGQTSDGTCSDHGKFDAVCVFDADNLVSQNYLAEMNKYLCKGYTAIQGYIDSKNPYDSWISCSYSISFWLTNRLFQYSRFSLGLTCGLCGTGFCVDTSVLERIGWGATCLTEDLEFTMKLALHNRKVAWAHNAIVYDEKPLTLKQSWIQRKRWMQGHMECAIRYLKPMVRKALIEGDLVAFDCALYLIQPVRTFLIGFLTIMMWIQSIYPDSPIFTLRHIFPPELWFVFVIIQFVYGPSIILAEKKLKLNTLLGFLLYPVYCLTWVPITIQGIFTWSNREWRHTTHTRNISIKELE